MTVTDKSPVCAQGHDFFLKAQMYPGVSETLMWTQCDVWLFFSGFVDVFEPDSEASLQLSHCVYLPCVFSWTRPSMFILLSHQSDWVVLCVMICSVKLLLDFLAPHQAGHSRSQVPTRGSHRPASHGFRFWYPLLSIQTLQHPKEPLQEVRDNLMFCSSSTLARLDWLCNGNWRFITPAGVTNHRRREAWGRMSRESSAD